MIIDYFTGCNVIMDLECKFGFQILYLKCFRVKKACKLFIKYLHWLFFATEVSDFLFVKTDTVQSG